MALTVGDTILLIIMAVLFLGLAEAVLVRMRLSRITASVLVGIMFLGGFLPDIRLTPGISVSVTGALIPLGVAFYLIITAGSRVETRRAISASLVTASLIYTADWLLPAEPGFGLPFDVDPLWIPGIIGGTTAYLFGRSRRSAFIAGVLGVSITDFLNAAYNASQGIPGAGFALGGAGARDAIIISGLLAVLLAETVGELREHFRPDRSTASGTDRTAQHRGSWMLVGSVILTAAVTFGAPAVSQAVYPTTGETPPGSYYKIVDTEGKLITAIGWFVQIGDEYINESNNLYRVIDVDGRTARAESLGPANRSLPVSTQPVQAGRSTQQGPAMPLFRWGETERRWTQEGKAPSTPDRSPSPFNAGDNPPPTASDNPEQPADANKGFILVYHTHNAESYVPTSNTSSINGRGGIHQVGAVLAEALDQNSFDVTHSQTLHLPHNRGAYRRSRRTVRKFLDRNPITMLDVHRDATPPQFYVREVEGEWMTQVRLVVGRQNPTRWANLQYALALKAIADERYPGLVKGIYHAQGNYNQDIGPRMLLLEFGTHTTARSLAEKSASLLAEVITTYFERQ